MADTTKQQADQSFFVFVKDTNTGRIRRMAIPADVQIGLQDNPAELQLLGRLSLAARDYSITSANQGILYVANDDTIISVTLVDTPTSGRITLYLPANPRNGQLHFVKDMSGTADSVPIDVVPSPGAKIDQFDQRTLTDKFGSIALYWFGDRWRILVSGLGLVNIGAADAAATYVTLSGNATLTNERRLNVSGTNLTMVDQGSNASVVLDLSQILGGGAGTFTYATVTADAFGRITAISAGANPPPNNASYITVTNEPGLSAERALVAGPGILLQDGGANTGITASVNNSVVATLTGSNFTGRVIFEDGVSGSIQQTHLGLSYLVAGPGITIFTQSNGQIIIGSPWTNNGTSLMTTSSVSIDGQGRFPASIGSDVYFFVSGTIGIPSGTANQRRVAVFGGDVRVSGSITVGTGSSTLTANDLQIGGPSTRVEKAGADLKFYDLNNPTGQTLSSLIGGGGGGGSSTAGNAVPFIITGSGWQTVYDRDFALESAYTASAGGLQTIAGLPIRIVNFNNAEFIGIVPGEGLIIDPNANSSDYYLTVHTAPTLYVTMSSMISDFNFSDYELRLWLQIYNQNDDANFEFYRWGFERANWSSNQNYAALWQKGFASPSNFHGAAFWSGSVEYIVAGVPVSNNIGCIHLLDDRNADYYSTSRSLGDMPDTPAGTTFAGSVRGVGQHGLSTNNLTLAPIWNTGSNVVITITSQPVNTNNSLRTVIRRMRLEALKKTVNVTSGTVLNTAAGTGFQQANYAVASSSNEWTVPNSTPFSGMPGVTASITTTGGPVLVLVNANYEANSAGATAFFSLARNGTNIGHSTRGMQAAGPVVSSYNMPVQIAYLDAQPAGTYTYALIGSSSQGTGKLGASGLGPTTINLVELKNANVASGTITSGFAIPGGSFNPVTGLSCSLTPTKGPVLLIGSTNYQGTGGGLNWDYASFFRDSTNLGSPSSDGLNANAINVASTINERLGQVMCFLDTSPTLGATNTYSIRASNGSGAGTINEGGMIGQLIAVELNDVNWKFNNYPTQVALGTNTDYAAPAVTPTPSLVTRGRPVMLMSLANANTTAATGRSSFTFQRNGVNVTTASKGLQISDGEGNNGWNKMPTLFWIDEVPAGSYAYKAVGSNISGSTTMAEGSQSTIFMWELAPREGGSILVGGWLDTGGRLSTTASVAVSDGTENITDPQSKGLDVYFYVSGTVGVSTASNPQNARVALFGGDVRVSGSLTVGSGSVKVTSNDVQFGDGARIERSATGLKFYDASNPSGQALSDLVGGGGGPIASVDLTASYADFVPAQSGQTMIRWKFDNANLVGNNIYLNTGVSSSVRLALTASIPNNIRTGQSGVFGESVGFSHAYLASSEPEAKIAGDKITVSTWIRPVVTGSGWHQIIAKEYTSGSWVSPFTPVSLYQLTSDNAVIEFGVTTGAGVRTTLNADSNTALKLKGEQWNHVVLVYNGAFLLGYVNGVEVARTSKTGNIDWGTTPGGWSIGGGPSTNAEQFSGSIDDIRIEAIAWTPEQVREHYETGLFRAYVTGSRGLVTHVSGNAIPDAPVAVTTVETVSYTGTTASFTVPDGITELDVKMWGAGAGNGAWPSNNTAGAGGYASGKISVTPGEQLFIIVGGGGQGTTGSSGDGGLGGWGGGGFGTKGDASGGGGGGYTGIFSGAIHQQTAIMIAGGGGGGTGFRTGGGGGGTTGGTVDNGTGGTQTAAGGPSAGGPLYGGKGTGQRTVSTGDDDGGGGGGYFGGGGGSGDGRGGGGGSGFLHPSRVTNGTLTAGENGNTSNTRANPPNTSDNDYLALAPTNTGKGGNTVGGNGTDGGHGFIVIRYTVGGQQAYWLEDDANTAYITSSVAIGTLGSAAKNSGQDTFFYVSGTFGLTGSNAKKSVFGGDVVVSGSISTALAPITAPLTSASWSVVNLGNATIVDEQGTIFISKPSQAGPQVTAIFKPAPVTPWKATALLEFTPTVGSVAALGAMYLRESSSGKLIGFGFHWDTGGVWRWVIHKLNSPTSANSDYLAQNYNMFAPRMWLQIEDDGATRYHRVSWDGKYFLQIFSVARTDFLTPDQVGFGVDTQGAQAQIRLVSWKFG